MITKVLVFVVAAAFSSMAAALDCPEGATERSRDLGEWSDHWCERVLGKGPAAVMHGPYESRWASGAPRIEGFYQDDKQDGLWRSRHASGPKSTEVYYENGKPHGEMRGYYANGELREQGTFDRGVKVGLWIRNYADGSPKDRETYSYGKLDGPYRSWRRDGARQEGTYKDGEEVGEWRAWDADGNEVDPVGFQTRGKARGTHDRIIRSTPMPVLPSEDPQYE